MKKNVTLLFPGQGSQYVGMGKEESKELFNQANTILGMDLARLCLEGPLEDLKLTQNTQPAIVTHSITLFRKLEGWLKDRQISIERTLGHSVGEYSALVASGALQFSDAVLLVHLRGKYMQDAVPVGKGKMFAIMRAPQEMILKACEESSNENEQVSCANFNSPEQIVISGHSKACEKAVNWIKSNVEGRVKTAELPVSAPFHSSLMRPAEEKLAKKLESVEFSKLKIPYIANINAKQYNGEISKTVIRDNLIKQICGSVQWTQSISQLSDETLCIEVGPGKILKGLVRKINPQIKVVSLDNESAFEELQECLK